MSSFTTICEIKHPHDYMDYVLRLTQRKTPTLVHKRWPLIRIRQFYIRKVKFASMKIREQFSKILDQFPILDDIHPFYSDLLNLLYDGQHYRIALGQIANSRHLIEKIERDFTSLLNQNDTFYGCKKLKKGALGRICSVMRMVSISLVFLEQVRVHMLRLPTLDPNMRTFIVCGSPNVGKSTFIGKVTRADVEVHPFAFTTKTLFVGHMEYRNMGWQIIDTPGLLDRPLKERNSIEMQTITALAHIGACSLFIVDISENCGYTLNQQANLFESLKPLFKKKPIAIICNKIDLLKPNELTEEKKSIMLRMLTDTCQSFNNDLTSSSFSGMELLLGMSTLSEEGLAQVVESVCNVLLRGRIETKLKSRKLHRILQHIQPIKLSQTRHESGFFIPRSIVQLRRQKNKGIYDHDQIGFNNQSQTVAKQLTIAPELFNNHNIFDWLNMDLAKNLLQIQDEESQMFRRWAYGLDFS